METKPSPRTLEYVSPRTLEYVALADIIGPDAAAVACVLALQAHGTPLCGMLLTTRWRLQSALDQLKDVQQSPHVQLVIQNAVSKLNDAVCDNNQLICVTEAV